MRPGMRRCGERTRTHCAAGAAAAGRRGTRGTDATAAAGRWSLLGRDTGGRNPPPDPVRSAPRYVHKFLICRMHPLPLRLRRCASIVAAADQVRAPQQLTQPCYLHPYGCLYAQSLPTALSQLSIRRELSVSLSSEPTNQRHNSHHSTANSTAHTTFGQARARAARRAAAPTCRRVVLSTKSRRAHMPTRCTERKEPPRPHADALY